MGKVNHGLPDPMPGGAKPRLLSPQITFKVKIATGHPTYLPGRYLNFYHQIFSHRR